MRPVLLVLALALAVGGSAGGCAVACPAALLEGVLTREGEGLVVVREDGIAERVAWSRSGHRVRERGGVLVVVDWLGAVVAHEGDVVHLGGGESTDDRWVICGMFEVEGARPG
jgi:hypothetical protein